MPRFVVLEHRHRGVHWDFMLEWGEVLRTWALAAPPAAGRAIDAEALFDHRLKYLDYEGPLSGDRGSVRRWDAGQYERLEDGPERVSVRLQGSRLEGKATLEFCEPPSGWRFSFAPAHARTE